MKKKKTHKYKSNNSRLSIIHKYKSEEFSLIFILSNDYSNNYTLKYYIQSHNDFENETYIDEEKERKRVALNANESNRRCSNLIRGPEYDPHGVHS